VGRHRTEEKWNAITHAFGLGMCFAFFISGSFNTRVISFFLMLTYSFSTLYHATQRGKIKDFFRMLDMTSIHVTIAGTSVSYILVMGGGIRECIPSIILGVACTQYVICQYGKEILEKTSVLIYVLAGAFCFGNVLFLSNESLSLSLTYFVSGCVVYLVGLVYYIFDSNPYYHTIWHIFVLGASCIHVFGTM